MTLQVNQTGVMGSDFLPLFVAVPITSFRAPKAREYLETLPCPPPATVYGMLLSLVGEEDRCVHEGAQLAIGLTTQLSYSSILRTIWRIKDKKNGPGIGSNKRPDFQEILTGLEMLVMVRAGSNEDRSLKERLEEAFTNPENVERFGGLSLGESTYLVDEIRYWRMGDPDSATMLVKDLNGDLTLPVWVDHVGSKDTVFEHYSLVTTGLDSIGSEPRYWTTIKSTSRAK
mgnify:CR=1 FL=1